MRPLHGANRTRREGAAVAAVAAVSGVALIAINYTSAPHGDFATGTGGFLLPQEPLFVVSVAVLVWLTGATLMRHGGALTTVTRLLSRYSLGIYILHPIVIYAVASPLSAATNGAALRVDGGVVRSAY